MKIKLTENTLTAHINEAVQEELNEILGLSRNEKNAKWGYEWNDNLTPAQNRALRNVNKANIKAKGYRNYDEYRAGESPIEEPEQEQQMEIPVEYPYKANRQKTGQFQTWFNDNMGGKLVVDGIWGPRTEAAYQQWINAQNKQ